eukprot:gene20213-biopygen5562
MVRKRISHFSRHRREILTLRTVARAWRGLLALLAWGGAGVARAWRGRGAGIPCSPWNWENWMLSPWKESPDRRLHPRHLKHKLVWHLCCHILRKPAPLIRWFPNRPRTAGDGPETSHFRGSPMLAVRRWLGPTTSFFGTRAPLRLGPLCSPASRSYTRPCDLAPGPAILHPALRSCTRPWGNRTVARAWRGLGIFWLGVARAWRGHGAGVARAFPVPPGGQSLNPAAW